MADTPDLPDDHQPGMDTEAHSDPHPVALLQVGIKGLHGPDNPEAGAHGALGVVFMGLGIAKVDEQAIAEILGNVPVHALDHLSTGVLVGAHDLAEVFRVELTREAGGIHKVAEHDGELAALGIGGKRCD